MPIYEYECESCQTLFEIIVSSHHAASVVCEKCGSGKVRKLISAAGIIGSTGSHKAPFPEKAQCQARGGFR